MVRLHQDPLRMAAQDELAHLGALAQADDDQGRVRFAGEFKDSSARSFWYGGWITVAVSAASPADDREHRYQDKDQQQGRRDRAAEGEGPCFTCITSSILVPYVGGQCSPDSLLSRSKP